MRYLEVHCKKCGEKLNNIYLQAHTNTDFTYEIYNDEEDGK